MAEVKTKSYAIVEVLHSAIQDNLINKDGYASIAKILYQHSKKDSCIVKLSELLEGYPKEKFTLVYKSPVEIEVYDTEKKSTVFKYYRDNKLV